ncbi:MAG: hypothetical protein IPK82_39680 [Polyangiaceae bacterium]|nr:hypothetical protein [Polyangiaceae bacterium]
MMSQYRTNANAAAFQTTGAVREGALYVERFGGREHSLEDELYKELKAGKSHIVLGPPASGKSSLKLHVQRKFTNPPCVDVRLAECCDPGTAADFFYRVAEQVARGASAQGLFEDTWREDGEVQQWLEFVQNVAREKVKSPSSQAALVLFFDDIQILVQIEPAARRSFLESLLTLSTNAEFPIAVCLLGCIPPRALVENVKGTPFEEGRYLPIELVDFSKDDLCKSNEKGHLFAQKSTDLSPSQTEQLLQPIMNWTSGHPQLVQELCLGLIQDDGSWENIKNTVDSKKNIESAVDRVANYLWKQRPPLEDSPLFAVENYLSADAQSSHWREMLDLYSQVLAGKRIASTPASIAGQHLVLSGMVKKEGSGDKARLVPRNKVFCDHFNAEWVRAKRGDILVHRGVQKWAAADAPAKSKELLKADDLQDVVDLVVGRVSLTAPQAHYVAASQKATNRELEAQTARARTRSIFAIAAAICLALSTGLALRSYDRAATAQTKAEQAQRETAAAYQKYREEYFARREAVVRGLLLDPSSRRSFDIGGGTSLLGFERGLEILQSSDVTGALASLGQALVSRAQGTLWVGQTLPSPAPDTVDDVLTAAVSADHARVATAGPGPNVGIWKVDSGALVAALRGHTDQAREVAFSRDGGHLLSVGNDGRVLLWKIAEGILPKELLKSAKPVTTCVSSPTQNLIATGGDDGAVQVWDVDTEKPISLQPIQGSLPNRVTPVTRVRFSPDGTAIAASFSDGTVRTWNVKSGQMRNWGRVTRPNPADRDEASVLDIVFTADGALLAAGDDKGVVAIVDPSSGRPVTQMNTGGHAVYSLAFSGDGQMLVAGSVGQFIHTWNLVEKRWIPGAPALAGPTNKVIFSPDGKLLFAVGTQQDVRIFARPSLSLAATLTGAGAALTDLVIWDVPNQNGTRTMQLLTTSLDGGAQLWKQSGGPPTVFSEAPPSVYRVAYSKNGNRIVAGSDDGNAYVWEGGKLLSKLPSTEKTRVRRVAFADDAGQRVVTAGQDGKVRVWDVKSAEPTLSFSTDSSDEIRDLASDKKWVLVGSDSGNTWLFDLDNRKEQWLTQLPAVKEHHGDTAPDRVTAVALSSTGVAAAGSHFGAVFVRNATNATDPAAYLLQGDRQKNAEIRSLSFSPDGTKLAAAVNGGEVIVWDVAQKKELLRTKGHTVNVVWVEFSPNGRQLASAGLDGVIRVWNTDNWSNYVTFVTRDSKALWVRYSSDGALVAAGFDNGQTRVWSLSTNEVVAEFTAMTSDVWHGAFSSDNTQLATASEDGAIRIYDVTRKGIISRACASIRLDTASPETRSTCQNK